MKQYEWMMLELPPQSQQLDVFREGMDRVLEELNRLGEDQWKESFKHGGFLILRRRKPDGILRDDPVEPSLPSLTQ